MNLAEKLKVISIRSQQNKPIYDLFRMLHQKELWNREQNLNQSTYEILQAVYTPVFQIFQNNCYSFYPEKKYHIALTTLLTKNFSWILCGCIKKIFPQLDAEILFLSKKISLKIEDNRFIKLIESYIRKQNAYHWETDFLSQTLYTKDSLIAILAQIYINEFDQYIADLQKNVNQKIVCYIRYANQFLIGMNGAYQQAIQNKNLIQNFLENFLHLQLDQKYFTLEPSYRGGDFLEHKIHTKIQQVFQKDSEPPNYLELSISKKHITHICSHFRYGDYENNIAVARKNLINFPNEKIVRIYQKEISGVLAYYKLIPKRNTKFHKLIWLARSSLFHTLAMKYRVSVANIAQQFQDIHLFSTNTE